MSLRIACDLDGTLADMNGALQREAERLFDGEIDLSALSDEEMRRVWAQARDIENFWTTLSEIEPGAVASLAARAAMHGWQLIFLTQRPETSGETAQLQTQRWLEAHGFELPSVYVMNGSRGRAADALQLDAVIDDRPENCLDVKTDSKARALLVWRDSEPPPPAAARLGIVIVRSVAAALTELETMMPPAASRDWIGRMRAAMGL
jgi:hypothetical protein